jgi:antitoxin FitA
MTSITIPDLEDELKARLSQQAAWHGRSIEDEAHDILRKALGEDRTAPPNLAAAIRARFAALGGVELPEPPREDIREPPNFER